MSDIHATLKFEVSLTVTLTNVVLTATQVSDGPDQNYVTELDDDKLEELEVDQEMQQTFAIHHRKYRSLDERSILVNALETLKSLFVHRLS